VLCLQTIGVDLWGNGGLEREIYFCIESKCTKIQNNLAKHKINKYNDFLMRGSEKTMCPAE